MGHITPEHRPNADSVVLMYTYFHGKCSAKIEEIYAPIDSFNRTARLLQRLHSDFSWRYVHSTQNTT